MTTNPYQNGLFFTGLAVLAGILQSLLYGQVGAVLPSLPSFANFFLTINLISFVSTGFLLWCFYKQQYWVAFSIGSVAFLTALLRAMLLYCLLVPLTRAVEGYYLPVLFLDISAGILFAGSLFFSRSGKNGWLKATGVFNLLLGGSTLALLIWSTRIGQNNPTLENAQLWLSWASSLSPLLVMGYFGQQLSLQTRTAHSDESTGPDTLIGIVRAIGVLAFLILGVALAGEGIKASHPSPTATQMARIYEARTFIDQRGDTLPYRLLRPADYDATQRYPLVVILHGGAGYGTDNVRQLDGWEVQQMARPENQKKYPAFVVVPQCSRGSSWGGVPKLIARDTVVFNLMKALEREFTIDTDRRYVAGGSLGGYGTWHFIGTRPGVFAAAIPLCGGGDPALAKNMVNVDIWAFHGDKDKNVPVEKSQIVIRAIQKAGGHPRYTEFQGVGHDVQPGLNATPGIIDWLFAQRRKDTVKQTRQTTS